MNDKNNPNIQVYQIDLPQVGDPQDRTDAILSSLDNALYDLEKAFNIDTEILKIDFNNPPSMTERLKNIESRISALEEYGKNELDIQLNDHMESIDFDLITDQTLLSNNVQRFNSINTQIAQKISQQDIKFALQPSAEEVEARGDALFEQLQKANDAKRLEQEERKSDAQRLAEWEKSLNINTSKPNLEEQKQADIDRLANEERKLFGENGLQLYTKEPEYTPISAAKEEELMSPDLNKANFFSRNKMALAGLAVGLAIAGAVAAIILTGGVAAIPGLAAFAEAIGTTSATLTLTVGGGAAAGLIGASLGTIGTSEIKVRNNNHDNLTVDKTAQIGLETIKTFDTADMPSKQQGVQEDVVYGKLPKLETRNTEIIYSKLPNMQQAIDAAKAIKPAPKDQEQIKERHLGRLKELSGARGQLGGGGKGL